MLSSSTSSPRAGVWRRAVAFTLDCLLMGVVVAAVGPITFILSGGRVQLGGVGVNYVSCRSVTSIPDNLEPPPISGSNHAESCTGGAFPGLTSKRFLVVGLRTIDNGRIEDKFQSYPLSILDQPVAAIDLTWLGQLAFVGYLVVGLIKRGRTLGMWLMRIRLVDLSGEPRRTAVSISRFLVRLAVAVAGFVPAVLVLALGLVAGTPPVGILVVVALLLLLGWVGVNVVLVARKSDPIYDHVAGLEVLVDQKRTPSMPKKS